MQSSISIVYPPPPVYLPIGFWAQNVNDAAIKECSENQDQPLGGRAQWIQTGPSGIWLELGWVVTDQIGRIDAIGLGESGGVGWDRPAGVLPFINAPFGGVMPGGQGNFWHGSTLLNMSELDSWQHPRRETRSEGSETPAWEFYEDGDDREEEEEK